MINLIDIGARGGISPPWRREDINYLLLCDADEEMVRIDDKCRILKECIYNDNETRLFYTYQKINTSSIFKPNWKVLKKTGKSVKNLKKKYKLIKANRVKCCRLDDLLKKYEETYNFVKTDAQGADLAILQGMGKYINKVVGIHCECFLIPEYQEIPLYDNMLLFLSKHGFIPSRIITKHKNWIDILFVRDEDFVERNFINNLYRRYKPYTRKKEILFFKRMSPYRKKK